VITEFALEVLSEMARRERDRGAKPIAKALRVGHRRVQAAITDLRVEGLIETKQYYLGPGKFFKGIEITSIGRKILSIDGGLIEGSYRGSYLQQTQQNSSISYKANSINSKPNSETSSREARVEYYETEEDRQEAQRKHYARKQKEKDEQQSTRREQSMARRSESNAFNWSVTDSTFEFAEQMHGIWHIEPWSVTRSRFRFALATKRSEYGTTGDIELVMMRLYFSMIKHDTKLRDPEMVWKRFITGFGVLLEDAKRSMVTPDQVEEIKAKALKSQEWMDNV